MVGRNDRLSHTLVPLSVAVTLVRERVYGARRSAQSLDPNGIAVFIAGAVPLYEYSDDASVRPRALHCIDGRPAKRLLAVHAEDVTCVVEMLKDPEHAVLIRRLALKKTGRRLLDKANELMEQWQSLRQRFRMLSEHHRHLMLRYRKRNSARG
jgi:hypothetical protein